MTIGRCAAPFSSTMSLSLTFFRSQFEFRFSFALSSLFDTAAALCKSHVCTLCAYLNKAFKQFSIYNYPLRYKQKWAVKFRILLLSPLFSSFIFQHSSVSSFVWSPIFICLSTDLHTKICRKSDFSADDLYWNWVVCLTNFIMKICCWKLNWGKWLEYPMVSFHCRWTSDAIFCLWIYIYNIWRYA